MNFQTNLTSQDSIQTSRASTNESGVEEKLTYSVTEFAKALGIGRNVAYDLVHREGFPVIRVSKRRLIIPRKEALEWLSKNSLSGESEVL